MNAAKLPVGQRPGMAGASLASRLDAVFGALDVAAGGGGGGTSVAGSAAGAGWSLRQDVQPFQVRKGGGRGVSYVWRLGSVFCGVGGLRHHPVDLDPDLRSRAGVALPWVVGN